jgi:hypothetical protein
LLAVALDALSHVSVEVLVVATVEIERAVALHHRVSHSSWLAAEVAASRVRERRPGVRTIAFTDDPRLLAALEPEDRSFTLTGLPDTTHGVLAGEISMRAVLWWLVAVRGAVALGHRP